MRLTKRQPQARKLSKPIRTLLGKIERGCGAAPRVQMVNYFADLNRQEKELVKSEIQRPRPLLECALFGGDLRITDAGGKALAERGERSEVSR